MRTIRIKRRRKPNRLANEMCTALGINPEGVIGFTLEVRAGALPNLTVVHEAWDMDAVAFARTLTNYKLTN